MPILSESSVIDNATLEKIKLIADELGARSQELVACLSPLASRLAPPAESAGCDCIDVIEKLQRIAYGAVRDSIAYRLHLATRKYATFDDVEYFMPDDIDQFDIDALCKRLSQTPECLVLIRGSYDLFLHREPSVDEVEHWRSRIATGDASWIDLNTFLQKEVCRLKREGKPI